MSIDKIFRIAITGPESSGKSTLVDALKKQHNASSISEYARTHLENNGKAYTYSDVIEIAQNQILLEREAIKNFTQNEDSDKKNRFVFFDTDLYVLKIWSEIAFGKCESFILDHLANDSYDMHLLCKPDLPWVFDEFREHPKQEQRNFIYQHYLDAMQHQPKPWFEISGEGNKRIEMAEKAIQSVFQ
jgi:NadR type nicotinamide-nucleotide adenylyltransferase